MPEPVDGRNPGRGGRAVWLDAARVTAACGILLNHSSTDTAGDFFPQAETANRVFPVVVKMVGEFTGTEFFITVALFLLASQLHRRGGSYASVIGAQAKRLFVPFVFWTVFYAFYRLPKAYFYGYSDNIIHELSQWQSWVSYFLLGTVQFHMHFFPTLFGIVLLYPVFEVALFYPLAALAVLPLLYYKTNMDVWLYTYVHDPMSRDYLLRLVKVLTYGGYGLFAFGLFRFWRDGVPRPAARKLALLAAFCLGVALISKLAMAAMIVQTGGFVNREGMFFYAYYSAPILVLLIFFGLQHSAWPTEFSRLARYGFGVLLVHPVFMDLYDILDLYARLDPPDYVIFKFLTALPLSLLLARAIARTPALAWTIGLGEPPALRLPALVTPGRARGA